MEIADKTKYKNIEKKKGLGKTMKQLLVISVLLIILGLGLCLVNFVFPYMITIKEAVQVPYIEQIPYQETENREQTLHTESGIISGGYYFTLPPDGVYISSGKTFKLSWSADGDLCAYILTETQFRDFQYDGIASNYEAYMYAREGTISAYIRHNDRYYATVSRPLFSSSVKLYQAQATLIWQETVTKTRNETRYRTEYIPKEVNSSLYLYSGLAIIGVGVVTACTLWKKKNKVDVNE
ncbi:MAG: hypothetical protein QW166_00400 [Candidatus Bathyarchaeia archaeon]